MKPYHTVNARLKTSWFFKPVMVYDIVINYEAWYDPSYGCGGGDWRKACSTVATFLDRTMAEDYCLTLNELNGDKK